jgi:ribosomal protein L37AE/L43A
MQSPHRACLQQSHFFFSEDLSEQVIAKKICASCPMLHPCTAWALSDHGYDLNNDYYWIIAGLDPDQRRRIREGRETFYDWTTDFSYAQSFSKAASRERSRKGTKKREQRRSEMPCCPGCGSSQYVNRDGRDRETDRQKYRCTACGPYFLGEEL